MNKELDNRINYDKIESEKICTAAYIRGYKGEKLIEKETDENYLQLKEAFDLGIMDKIFNENLKNC